MIEVLLQLWFSDFCARIQTYAPYYVPAQKITDWYACIDSNPWKIKDMKKRIIETSFQTTAATSQQGWFIVYATTVAACS